MNGLGLVALSTALAILLLVGRTSPGIAQPADASACPAIATVDWTVAQGRPDVVSRLVEAPATLFNGDSTCRQPVSDAAFTFRLMEEVALLPVIKEPRYFQMRVAIALSSVDVASGRRTGCGDTLVVGVGDGALVVLYGAYRSASQDLVNLLRPHICESFRAGMDTLLPKYRVLATKE